MKQNWLHSPTFDLIFILLPAWIVSFAVLFIPSLHQSTSDISPFAWLILVLMIDVAHVHSTLYRTYLDKEAFSEHAFLFSLIPLLCWTVGVLFYSLSAKIFWSALAYLAVFHFIRQQYGFFRIYTREEKQSKWLQYLDISLLYVSMLYPLIYWHSQLPRNFHWFIEGDFLSFSMQRLEFWTFKVYYFFLIFYLVKEFYFSLRFKHFSLAKNLILGGTALSWYVGIVYFNSDLPFTLTNVLPHGIPYFALIWIYGRRKNLAKNLGSNTSFIQRNFYKIKFIPLFLGLLWLLAYLEEGLWDAWVWRDHEQLFSLFNFLNPIQNHNILSWLIPLLALPQATHYVLDGFIWRWKKDQKLKEVFSS